MNRLLSLEVRGATDLDVEATERSRKTEVERVHQKLVLQKEKVTTSICPTLVNDGEKEKKDVDDGVNVPSLVEIQEKKKEVVEVKFLSIEEIEKLYERLPGLSIEDEFVDRLDIGKPKVLKEEKFEEISFPPNEQKERDELIQAQYKIELLCSSFNPRGGPHSLTTPIRITFSQRMVSEKIGQVGNDEQDRIIRSRIVEVTPELPKGVKWRFETDKTILFEPTEQNKLVGSTKYSVVVPRGVTSVEGNELEKTVKFSFSTARLTVQNSTAKGGNPPILTKRPVIGLKFSQAIDPLKVIDKISVRSKGKILQGKKLTLELLKKDEVINRVNNEQYFVTYRGYSVDPMTSFGDSVKKKIVQTEEKKGEKLIKKDLVLLEDYEDDILFFTTKERLDADKQYTLKIEKGMESLSGNLESDHDRTYEFRTMSNLYRDGTSIKTEYVYEYDKISWYASFNNNLNPLEYEKNKKDWIKLENIQDAVVWIEKDKIWIKGRIKKGVSKALITLTKSIEDVFYSKLAKDDVFKIKVDSRNFKVTSHCGDSTQYYNDNVSWWIYFNHNINEAYFEENKDELVTVTPKLVNQKFIVSGSRLTLRGTPLGTKNVVIEIKKDFQCSYETELKADKTIRVKVKKTREHLESQHHKSMFVHDITNNSIPISFRFKVTNIKKLYVLIYQVDPKDHWNGCPLGRFSKYCGNFKKVKPKERVNLPEKLIIFEGAINTDVVFNEKKQMFLDVERYLQDKEGKTGNLFVYVYDPADDCDESRIIYSWIQVTKMSFESVFTNDQSLTLVANSLDEGKLIKDPEFDISFYQPTKFFCKKEGWNSFTYKYYTYKDDTLKLKGDSFGLATYDFSKTSTKNFVFPFAMELDQKNLKYYQSALICLRRGNDVCFMPDVEFKNECDVQKPRLIDFVFNDKGIFKPTEDVKIGAMLRVLTFENQTRKLFKITEGMKIKYIVSDGRKIKFLEGEVVVDDCSSFYLTFKIKKEINLGDCSIEFQVEKESKPFGEVKFYHKFKVEEFKAPEFLTECKVAENNYFINDLAILTGSAKYYSGAGLSDCNAKWTVQQKCLPGFKPPTGRYDSYNFAIEAGYRRSDFPYFPNDKDVPKKSYTFTEKTNDSGEHKLLVGLRDPKKFQEKKKKISCPTEENHKTFVSNQIGEKKLLPTMWEKSKDIYAPIEISAKCEVTDLNHNVLLCQNTFMVHPCKVYIGLRKSRTDYYVGDKFDIEVVVVNAEGKLIQDVEISFELFKDGTKMKEYFLKSTKDKVEYAGIEFFQEWGRGTYVLFGTIMDNKGYKHCTSLNHYIRDPPKKVVSDKDLREKMNRFILEYPPDYKEDVVQKEILRIVLDKPKFFVNDIAKVMLSSPIQGQGVIFALGAKILWRSVFMVDDPKNSVQLEMKITELFVPNCKLYAYVFGKKQRIDLNNFSISQLDEAEIRDMPSYAAGFATVRTDPKYFEMEVKVEPRDVVTPPSVESEIFVAVDKPGAIVTTLVIDESVLSMTGYNLANKWRMEHFYPNNCATAYEFFLRNHLFVRKWKANKKKIEEEKAVLMIEIKKREEIRRKKELERKRREEERKLKEEEERKKKLLENERRRKEEEKREVQVTTNTVVVSCGKESLANSKTMIENLYSAGDMSKFEGKLNERTDRRVKLGKGKKRQRSRANFQLKKVSMKRNRYQFVGRATKIKKKEMKGKQERNSREAMEKKKKKKRKKKIAIDDSDDDEIDDADSSECGEVDDSESDFEDMTPIQMRQLFESTVVFAKSVKTDVSGKATIKFKLPDNLTRYKIWTIAEFGASYFGFGESSMVTKLPFSVRNSIPTFLNYGDRSDLSFVLSNQTDSLLNINVAIRTSKNITLVDQKGMVVVLPRSKRKEVKFTVIANKVGPAQLQIGCSGKGYSDAIQKNIDVFTPTINSSYVTYGELDGNKNHVQQIVPPSHKDVFTSFGGIDISTSSTIFQSLQDAFLYTYRYMYDSVEQNSSRVLSIVSMIDVVKKFKLKDFDKVDQIERVMKTAMNKLAKAQKKNGSFGMWNSESKTNGYLSIHASHAAIRCYQKYPQLFKEGGGSSWKEFKKMLDGCKDFCKSITTHLPVLGYSKTSTQALRSFSLYVLAHFARLELLDEKEKKTLSKRTGKLMREMKFDNATNEAKAWLMYSLWSFSKEKEKERWKDSNVQKVLKSIYKTLVDKKERAFFHSSQTYEQLAQRLVMLGYSELKENGVILEVLCHIMPHDEIIAKIAKHLLKMKRFGRWGNTNSCSWILLGLSTYFNIFEKDEPDTNLNIWLKDQYCGEIVFKGREMSNKKILVPMEKVVLDSKEQLTIDEKVKKFDAKYKVFREKRRKAEEERREKESQERKKRDEENEKKKKKWFSFGSNKDEDVDDDLEFYASQVEKKKSLKGSEELEEEEEAYQLNQLRCKPLYIIKKGTGRCYYRIKFEYAPKKLVLKPFDFGFNVTRTYSFIKNKEDLVKDEKTGVFTAKLGALIRVRVMFKTKETRYHVALCENLPAGFEVLNPNLKTTVPIPKETESRYRTKWYDHINYRFSRVEVFSEALDPGEKYFSFVCRAKFSGNYISLPTRVECMYEEESCGQNGTEFVTILPKEKK